MTTYRLGSSGFIHAPGLVMWAVSGYVHEEDRPAILETMKSWSGVPVKAMEALLTKAVDYTVEDAVVVFDWTDDRATIEQLIEDNERRMTRTVGHNKRMRISNYLVTLRKALAELDDE